MVTDLIRRRALELAELAPDHLTPAQLVLVRRIFNQKATR